MNFEKFLELPQKNVAASSWRTPAAICRSDPQQQTAATNAISGGAG
jgi:hypothetical protein